MQWEDLPYAAYLTQTRATPSGDQEGTHLAGAQLSGGSLGGLRWLECAITDCEIERTSFQRSRWREVFLQRDRLVGCDLSQADLGEVRFYDSVLAGVDLAGASLGSVLFQDCKLDSINLRQSRLTSVRFEDCVLRDVDFAGATLKRVTVVGCEVIGLDLSHATCTDVDLTGARSLTLACGAEHLRGVRVSSAQLFDLAESMAAALGILIAPTS